MNQYNNILFFIGFIILSLINSIHTLSIGVENDNEDKFYLLFVKNEYNENGYNKRQEVSDSVYDLVNDIHKLIMNNTNTYNDPSILQNFSKLKKLTN